MAPLGTAPRPWGSQSEESAALSFTFTPSDEQLIVHYLRAYAAGQSLRWDHVVEAEVYSADPRSLLGDGGEIGYFLTKRTRRGSRVKRTAGGGTWTGQTRKYDIVSARGEVVGFKAMFSFCIDDDDCSEKPSKKTTGYVMYEYELPSTANKGARRQGESQEPVLCCIKRSAREIARSRKRKREQAAAALAPAAETDSGNSVSSSCILAAPESAPPEFALAGVPSRRFAADRSSALPTYLSADADSLFSNGSTETTIGVDQQRPIPYRGDGLVTTNAADIFDVGECGYYSALGTAADVNLQPIPDRGLWAEMMNADQQLLLQTVLVDEAGSSDQLPAVRDEDGFSDFDHWLLGAEPSLSLPPLVDSGMPFRDCRMPPIPSPDSGIASSAGDFIRGVM